jgi:branched-chain amino acid transport system substrate-binding protein
MMKNLAIQRRCGSPRRAAPLVLAVAVSLVAAGCASSGGSSAASSSGPGTIVIGTETGLTGVDQAVGVPQEDGITLAVDQINSAGGFAAGGHKYKIKIASEDDTSTPTVGVEVVQKLLGQNVHFLLGVLSSDVAQAFLPVIANQSSLITLVSGCALPKLTAYPGIFRTATPTVVDTAMDLNYIKQRGWKTIGIFTDRTHAGYVEETGVELAKLKSLGVRVVDSEEYTVGDTQYGSQLTKMLARHPQVIDLRGYATDAIRIAVQARQLGYNGPIITSSGPITAEVTQEHGAAAMANVYSLQSPGVLEVAGAKAGAYPAATIATAKAMSAAYQAKFKQEVGLLSGYSYQSVYMLVQAMKDAGTTTDIAKIRSALTSMKYSEVASHLAEPVTPSASGLLFQNHNTLSPGSVSVFKNGQFVNLGDVSPSYPGVTS